MSVVSGCAWKYGDNVNTDLIYPGKYLYAISDPEEMVKHALEDLDPHFFQKVKPNDIIVAGKNWGCGSSREQAVICLKESGVSAIIAKSFARIYYRNCLNLALPALTCPEAAAAIQQGEKISLDLEAGEIRCAAGRFNFPPLPETVKKIIKAGGLLAYGRQKLSGE